MERTLREIIGDGYIQGVGAKAVSDSKRGSSGGDSDSSNFEESEVAVVLEFVEENYHALYGHGTGSEIKAKKDRMWKKFVEEVNKVY